jgi:transposase
MPSGQAHPLAMAEELGEPLGDATPRSAPPDAPLRAAGHARALRWRQDFPAFYDQDPSYAPEYLRRWCSGAKRSRLQPIKDFVALVEKHWEGILAWHANYLSNGLLEGINALIQAAKARARGYRSKTTMITIVYLIAAKLPLPTLSSPTPAYMTSR